MCDGPVLNQPSSLTTKQRRDRPSSSCHLSWPPLSLQGHTRSASDPCPSPLTTRLRHQNRSNPIEATTQITHHKQRRIPRGVKDPGNYTQRSLFCGHSHAFLPARNLVFSIPFRRLHRARKVNLSQTWSLNNKMW